MAKQISWSPDAKRDYLLILDYLNARWSHREVLKFIDRTEEVLHLIADNPLLFVSSEKKPGVHRCVIGSPISQFVTTLLG